jgi:hypothetical protein
MVSVNTFIKNSPAKGFQSRLDPVILCVHQIPKTRLFANETPTSPIYDAVRYAQSLLSECAESTVLRQRICDPEPMETLND